MRGKIVHHQHKLATIMPFSVEANKNLQVPILGLRISVQWSFIYSIFNLWSPGFRIGSGFVKVFVLTNYLLCAVHNTRLCGGKVSVVKKLIVYLDRCMSTHVALGSPVGCWSSLTWGCWLRWEKLTLMRGLEKFGGQCDLWPGHWKFRLVRNVARL